MILEKNANNESRVQQSCTPYLMTSRQNGDHWQPQQAFFVAQEMRRCTINVYAYRRP
jgi:hypothetical protein